jgi:hypothetical protein
MRHAYLLLGVVLGAVSLQASACYTVYDRSDQVVYQSQDPPVDMSRPLHETLPSRFPGAHMVFDTAQTCPATSSIVARGRVIDTSTHSPLLTNERTAVAMGLPHTQLAGGIALVQARDAIMAPGLTVIPETRMAASRSNTSAMGAGPSPSPMITELRDPPAPIEEPGHRVIMRRAAR